MPIEGLAHQVDLWTDQRTDAEIALVGPLGCGKTRGLALKGLFLSRANPGLDGLLAVPSYKVARAVHVAEWPPIYAEYGVRCLWRAQDSAFVFPAWGGRIWVRSAENPSSMAGPNLAFFLGDEPGLWDREAFDRGTLRARHPKAKVKQSVLAGTPEGINWFADLFAAPADGRRTIWAREWHPDMAAYPERIAKTYGYDDSLLATYGRGQFVPLRQGRAYRFFLRTTHVHEPGVNYNPALRLVLSCDFNVDYMRWGVLQITPKEIRVLDAIDLGKGGSTQEAAKQFVSRWSKRLRLADQKVVTVTGDASGTARSTSGETDYQIIREVLAGAGLKIYLDTPPGNPLVKDRVDTANYHLAGRGRRVVIDPRCEDLIRDLERVSWRKGKLDLEKKQDESLTHSSDWFSYAVWRLAPVMPLAKPTLPSKAERANYRPDPDGIMGARF